MENTITCNQNFLKLLSTEKNEARMIYAKVTECFKTRKTNIHRYFADINEES